ncbi:hypothetical protein LguiB_020724 [Lonicera macranthoides]
MASFWKPEEEEIKEMCSLIELEQLFPADLNSYLVFILSRSELGGVYEWPELVQIIVNCLDSNVENQQTCGMGGVGKVCLH